MNQETVTITKADLAAVISDAVVDAVAKAMKKADHVQKLWTAADIAEYMDLSERHVADRVTVLPDFPKPICLPSCGGAGKNQKRRWEREEVIKWVRRQKPGRC